MLQKVKTQGQQADVTRKETNFVIPPTRVYLPIVIILLKSAVQYLQRKFLAIQF
jgi:hypothetical protein